MLVVLVLVSWACFGVLVHFSSVSVNRRLMVVLVVLFVLFFVYWFFSPAGFALMVFVFFYWLAGVLGGGWSAFKDVFYHVKRFEVSNLFSVFSNSERSVSLGGFIEELQSFKDEKVKTLQWRWVERRGVFTLNLEGEVNRHVIVVGSSGFGKSNLLKNLAFKISRSGRIHVLDSHGEYSKVVKGGVVRVGEVGLNLWDLDGKPVSWRVNENVSVMRGVLDLGDVQAYYLAMAARNAFERKGFKEGESVEVESFNRGLKPPSAEDVLREVRKLEGLNSSVKTLGRRLEMLSWSNLFPASDSVNLDELGGESVVFDLSGIPSLELKVLFVEVYLRKVYNKAVSTGFDGLTVLIDEAESLIFNSDRGGFVSYADRLSAEARKFGVGLIIGTQRCTGLSRGLVNNSGVFFSFFLREPVDAKYVAKLLCGNSSDEWKLSVVQEKINVLGRGEFLVVSSVYRDPVLVRGDLFKEKGGLVQKQEVLLKQSAVQKSLAEEERELIKLPEVKTEVLLEKELSKGLDKQQLTFKVEKSESSDKSELSKEERRIMSNIKRSGWVNVRDVMNFNGVGKVTAVSELNSLIEKGLIRRRGSGPNTYYVLNDEIQV